MPGFYTQEILLQLIWDGAQVLAFFNVPQVIMICSQGGEPWPRHCTASGCRFTPHSGKVTRIDRLLGPKYMPC